MEDSQEKSLPRQETTKPAISRRDLLKAGLAGGAGAILFGKDVERREALIDVGNQLVMIDFAPEHPSRNFHQQEFPDNNRFAKALTGGEYNDWAIKAEIAKSAAGIDWSKSEYSRLEQFLAKIVEKHPKAGLVYGALHVFGNHGEQVAGVMRRNLRAHGYTITPEIIPIQTLFDTKKVEFTTDELGNKGFFVHLEPEPVIEALKKYPEQKVVNLSWQMGRVGYVLEKKHKISGKVIDLREPHIREVGAYQRESRVAVEDFGKLLKVCEVFPDKLFVAAAGNFHEDILPMREDFKDNWPANLIVVAELGDNRPKGASGADIYVDNYDDLPEGSSFSVPMISSLATLLVSKGMSTDEVKKIIYSYCDNTTYKDYDLKSGKWIDTPIRIFNPEKVNTNA